MPEKRIADLGNEKLFGCTGSGAKQLPQGTLLLCYRLDEDVYKVIWEDHPGGAIDECLIDAADLLAKTRLKEE